MKDDSLNKLAVKSGIFFVVCQMLIRGISFATTPIYTRLLSTEQFGQIRVYESWLQIAVPIMSLCLWRSVERAKYDMREKFDSYTSAVQNLSYISIALMTGICLLFKPQIQKLCGMDDVMLYTAFGYIFSYTSVLYMNRREKQSMRYKFATAASVLLVVPATVISIGWLYIGNVRGEFDQLVHYRILGFYIPQIIGGLIIALIMAVQGKKLFSLKYWKYGLLYSIPLIPEVLSIQIMNQADKLMVTAMTGDIKGSVFAVATTVSYIIWILEDSVRNALLPWMITIGESRDICNSWSVLMHGFGVISWALVLFAPEIILILGGHKYIDAIYLVAPMVTGTLFRFYSYSYTAIQNYHKKTASVAASTVSVMFLNVFLNYLGILWFGYQAAAYTTAFSYMALMIIQAFMEKRLTGEQLIPLSKTLLISCSYFLLCVITMSTYHLPSYLRYLIAVIAFPVSIWYFLPKLKPILSMVRKKNK